MQIWVRKQKYIVIFLYFKHMAYKLAAVFVFFNFNLKQFHKIGLCYRNVTYSRAEPQQTPSVEKHAHPPRVVYCATYSTFTRFTNFRV